jgi:glycerol 3-phosphatase-2
VSGPVVCCDLDGVLWRGEDAIPGAAAGVGTLRDAGLRVVFVSNNSGRPVGDVVDRLGVLGVRAVPDDVLTSAEAAASLLARDLAPGSRVFACAGQGVVEALEAVHLVPVRDGPAEAVVVGIHTGFDYDELDRASRLVRDGARLIAANLDATYPVGGGLLPGSGAIVAAVATASGATPEVAGKPEPATVALVRERWGDTGVVVGDRPSSDGALATALGWPFALVLSGVTGSPVPPGGEAIPDPPPPFVAADLGSLAPELVATFAGAHVERTD